MAALGVCMTAGDRQDYLNSPNASPNHPLRLTHSPSVCLCACEKEEGGLGTVQ